MSNNENNILFYIYFLTCIILFTSCNKRVKAFDSKEINTIRAESIKIATQIVGENEYWDVYNSVNDSIKNWASNSLERHLLQKVNNWEIDSVLCFNQKGDKCRMSLMNQKKNDGNIYNESIWHIYGVKIGQQWYFFTGPTLILPRRFYQDNVNIHLSFEKLRQIATDEIYRGYLKKNKLGNLEINDIFFHDFTSVAWGSSTNTKEQWDSTYLDIVRRNWLKRDSTIK